MSEPVLITPATYPCLAAIMRLVEEDNGGHLIGTVYPGTPINLERFLVPPAWQKLVVPAEVALAALRASSPEDFETFAIGEFTEVERLCEQQAALGDARKLLEDWFNCWPAEDAPK